nr:GNAT family N-acetyltransferase [Shewanella olleyana]
MKEISVKIEVINTEAEQIVEQLVAGVRSFNHEQMGDETSKPLTVVIKDDNDNVIAGLAGRTIYNKFLINVLWVDEKLRGEGLGYKLMALAESEARKRGCLAAQVDTLAFQASDFYQKNGFTIIGTAPGFPGCPEQNFLFKHYD